MGASLALDFSEIRPETPYGQYNKNEKQLRRIITVFLAKQEVLNEQNDIK